MKKILFLLGLVGLFLLIVPSAYAALIMSGDIPHDVTGVNEGISTRVLLQVILNYVFIILGLLSLFLSIKNLVKGFKLKGTPSYDKKYFHRFFYFLFGVLVVWFVLFGVFNHTWCCTFDEEGNPISGGSAFSTIRLTF
jgi:hypothetical protein